MAHPVHIHHLSSTSLPAIHHVSIDNPWMWLAAGLSDFTRAPAISLAYGFLVTLITSVIFYLLLSISLYGVSLGLMAGFVIIGPLFAAGLYEASRRLEQHQSVVLSDTWRGWRRNSRSMLAIGVIMMLMMLAWFMLSALATAVVYGIAGELGPIIGSAADWQSFTLSIRWPVAVVFGLVGFIVVSVTFVITVVAVPMLTDKEEMDVSTAIVTSAQAVRKNLSALILWAGLIAVFTGVAVAPLFLGLIVVFPLLAHASWHAYRDMIEH